MSVTDKVNVIAGLYVAFAFETITFADTAKGLTEASYKNADDNFAKRALMTVESAQLRYRYDGVAPTALVGHVLNPGDTLILIGATNIKNFKAIRTGVTSSKVSATYEK